MSWVACTAGRSIKEAVSVGGLKWPQLPWLVWAHEGRSGESQGEHVQELPHLSCAHLPPARGEWCRAAGAALPVPEGSGNREAAHGPVPWADPAIPAPLIPLPPAASSAQLFLV